MVAQYNASQLLTMREVVSRDIRRILTERARFFDIVLDDVSITQLTFSKVYEAAIEAKQVAQQEAERAKYIVSWGGWVCWSDAGTRPQRHSCELGCARCAAVSSAPAMFECCATGGEGAAGEAEHHRASRG